SDLPLVQTQAQSAIVACLTAESLSSRKSRPSAKRTAPSKTFTLHDYKEVAAAAAEAEARKEAEQNEEEGRQARHALKDRVPVPNRWWLEAPSRSEGATEAKRSAPIPPDTRR